LDTETVLINCSLLPLQCAELVVITLHFQQQQHKKAKELMSSCCIATEYYLRYPSTINRTRKKCVPCSKVERYDAAEERRQVAPRACPSAHRGIHRLDRLSFLRIVSADCSAAPATPPLAHHVYCSVGSLLASTPGPSPRPPRRSQLPHRCRSHEVGSILTLIPI
jgi:hypothetical protein